MDVRADLTAACSTSDLLPFVHDLAKYPAWMRLAHRVESLPDDPRGPAWSVELRAQVGPLARSKRLRMVRVSDDGAGHLVFERHESDGRRHSPWVLTVTLTDDATRDATRDSTQDAASHASSPSSHLVMHLHYGGKLWTGGVLERILSDEIERGRDRLVELASGNAS